MITKQEKLKLISKVPFWWHSIDCGDEIVTNGRKSSPLLEQELVNMALPDLQNKTVLDIGCWDGFFAFKAEELGAERVVAMDDYVWSMNLAQQQKHIEEYKSSGKKPQHYHLIPRIWKPSELPGKIGFDTVHYIKESCVEQIVGNFMSIDPTDLGNFDIVFFLGVLYHLEDPLRALKRLSLLTKNIAIIETLSIFFPEVNQESSSLLEFFESDEMGNDVGNWFAPNLVALAKMLKAAGFKNIVPTSVYPPYPTQQHYSNFFHYYRLTVHAYK
ncbi:DUF1698 domain-containing protein [Nostoc sp.]|uniref:DUF1698 domain-containing protein n=1 Tax=Nostoc sp. TaxID=1180 RepID=UPI002FFD2A00